MNKKVGQIKKARLSAGQNLITRQSTLAHKKTQEVRPLLNQKQFIQSIQSTTLDQDIFDTIHNPLLVLDSDLRVIIANRSFYHSFKVRPHETIGQLIYDLANGQWNIPRLRTLLEDNLLKTHFINDYEVQHDFPGIGHKSLQLNARRITHKDTNSHFFLLSMEDINERKWFGTEALRESKDKYHSLYDSMTEIVALHEVIYDSTGRAIDYRILDCNPAFETSLGIPCAKAIGQLATKVYGTQTAPYLETYAKTAKSGEPTSFETYFPSLDKYFNITAFSPKKGTFATVSTDITERKRVEKANKESEEKYHSVVQQSSDGIVILQDNKLVFANPRMEEIWGGKAGELLNTPFIKYIHPDERAKVMKRYRLRLTGEISSLLYETTLIKKDGKQIPVEITGSVITYLGKPADLAIVRDISERKKVEENTKFQASLLNNVSDAVIAYDKNLKIAAWNKAAQVMFGWKTEEVLGRSSLIILKTDYPGTTREKMLDIIRTKGEWRGEITCLCKDGTRIPIEISSILLCDEKGKPNGYLSVNRDISERKKADEQLRFHASLLANLNDAVIAYDENRKIILWNKKAEEIYGWKAEEAQGHTTHELLKTEYPGFSRKKMQTFFNKYGETRNEATRVRKDGVRIPVEISSIALHNEKGKLTGYLSVNRDITERKRAENELLVSEEHYRGLFENSPISLWEEDFSAVKNRLDELKKQGISDLHAYLESHPNEVIRCASLVKVLDVNKATLKLFHAKKKADLLKPLLSVLSPQTLQEFREELNFIAEGRTHFKWETKNQTVTGETIDVSMSWSVSPGHENDFSKVIISMIDITERKLAEEAIQIREERYRSLVETQTSIISRSDLKGNLTFVNTAYCKAFGKTKEELLGHTFLSNIIPEDKRRVENVQKNLMKPPHRYSIENRQFTPKGIRWFDWDGSALMDEKGKIIEFQGVGYDITERKLNEQKIALISGVQRELIGINDSKVIYRMIGKQVQKLIGEGYVVVSCLEESSQSLQVEGYYGFGTRVNQIAQLMGLDPHRTTFYIKDMTASELRKFRSGKLERMPGGLYAMLTREVPKPICERAEKMLGINAVYTIGIIWKGNHYGGLTILPKVDIHPVQDAIEAILSQASITLYRIHAQQELQVSENKFRQLAEQAVDGIFQLDSSYYFTYANASTCQMLGYSPQELSKINMLDTYLPEEKHVGAERLSRLSRGERLYFERDLLRKDGSLLPISVSAVCLEDGKIQAIIHDISARKTADEQIRFHASLLTNLNDAVIASDANNKITAWNKAAEEIYGWKAEEVLGHSTLGLLKTEYLGCSRKKMQEIFYKEGKWRGEATRVRKDGVRFPVEISSLILRDEKGEISGFLSVNRDITEQKLAEEQIKTNAARAEALVQIAARLNSELKLNEVLHTVCEETARALDVQTVIIVLYDPLSECFKYSASYGFPKKFIPQFKPISLTSAKEFFQQKGRTGSAEDLLELEGLLPNAKLFDSIGLKSIAVTHLINQENLLGRLLVFTRNRKRVFSSDDQKLFLGIADQASQAIKNAQLLEDIQKNAERLSLLNRINHSLSSTLQLDEILKIVYQEIKAVIKSDAFYIALYDETQKEIDFRFNVDEGISYPPKQQSLAESLTSMVIKSKEPLLIHDLKAETGILSKAIAYGSQRMPASWLGLPMVVAEHVIGVISVQSYQPNVYGEEEKELLATIADSIALAIEKARLFESTTRHLEQVQILHSIDSAISSSFDLQVIFKVLLGHISRQLGIHAADILVFNPDLNELNFAAQVGFRTSALQHTHLRLGGGYAGQAALERHIIQIPNLKSAPSELVRSLKITDEDFVAYFAAPLIAKGKVHGVLELFHRQPLDVDSNWLEFLETLAGQAAIAIDNTNLYQDLQQSNQELTLAYDATIEGWSHALDLRDRETEGHTQRVVNIALNLAKVMEFPEKDMINFRHGALLHDIGKMGIMDTILRKEGPLNDEEWIIMRNHPNLAFEWLSPITYLKNAVDIPYCHHEKWDGSGYPRGLKGEEIPLAARIFAIVDVWDALTSDRPYRAAWSLEKALDYIREQRGKHFDPAVVDAFLNNFDKIVR